MIDYDRQSMPGLSLPSRLGRTRLAKRVPQPDAKRSCSHKSQQTLAGSWPGVCYGQVLFCFLFVFFAWVLGDLFATQVQCKTNRAEILLVHCFLCDYGYFIPRVGLRNMRFSCRIFLVMENCNACCDRIGYALGTVGSAGPVSGSPRNCSSRRPRP